MKLRATLMMALAAVLIGCGNGPAERDPQRVLPELEQTFGIRFPTNAAGAKAASGHYRGLLDGNSRNTETIVRLDLTSSALQAWRRSTTNSLSEYKLSPTVDPRFENKFSWWDLNRFPRDRFTHSFYEINNGPNDYRKLTIDLLELGPTNIMYISGFVLKR
jgi:hypothetical protein